MSFLPYGKGGSQAGGHLYREPFPRGGKTGQLLIFIALLCFCDEVANFKVSSQDSVAERDRFLNPVISLTIDGDLIHLIFVVILRQHSVGALYWTFSVTG